MEKNELTGRTIHRLLRFHLQVREGLLTAGLATIMLVLLSPDSMSASVIDSGKMQGQIVLWTMAVMVALGAIDMLVNDVLPDRFSWMWMRRHRHTVYMLLGACYAAQAVASFDSLAHGEWVLITYYVNCSFRCAQYGISAIARPNHAL